VARSRTGRAGRRKPSERELREVALWDGFKAALQDRGWTVSVARTLDGRGGHCVVRGERRVILAARVPVPDRVEMLAELLSGEDLDVAALAPELQERLALVTR